MIVESGHGKLGRELGDVRLQLLAPGLDGGVAVQHVVEVLQLLR